MAGLLDRLFARAPWTATAGYVALVLCLGFSAITSLTSLEEHYEARESAQALLDQMEGRGKPGDRAPATQSPVLGSPFLEGQTLTVAGATLQERIGAAVKAVGGNVLSSQIDLQGIESKNRFVTLTASCELDQPALQQLLYDIEAGMPFMFVDQLTVQSPQGSGTDAARMRVLIGVSGQWQGSR